MTAWRASHPAAAHADTRAAPAPLELRVAPDVPEIDPTVLRTDLGAELGVDVVTREDTRADQAAGVVEVSVDRDRREVIVAYRGHGESIVRRIALAEDAAIVERDVVLLAGNLARDEARDLVERLRGQSSESSEARPVVSTVPPPLDFASEDAAEKRDLDALGRAIEPHAGDAGRAKVIGWTVAGGGLAVAGLSVGLLVAKDSGAALVTDEIALGLLEASGVFLPADFDPILRVYRSERASEFPADVVIHDVLEEWRRRADGERTRRRFAGWLLLGAGCVQVGSSLVLLATVHLPSTPWADAASYAGFTILGAGSMAIGLSELVTLGPMESSLRDYERTESKGAASGHGARLGPSVAPRAGLLPGGGFVGVGGRF